MQRIISRLGTLAAVFAVSLLVCRLASATDYYVDSTGKGPSGNGTNTYTTLTAALISGGSIPNGASAANPNRLYVYPGTYAENLGGTDPVTGSSVNISKSNIDIIGMAPTANGTVFSFNKNANTAKPGGTVGTTGSSSTQFTGTNVACYNVTFQNNSGYGTGQAVALLSQGDQISFLNCRFTGYQDTLYVRKGRNYFKDCYVTGTVDYIFGDGTAVFDNCTLNNSSGGTVTAANTSPTTANGYIFRNCTLTKNAFSYGGSIPAPPSTPGTNSVQLGRPWQWDSGSFAHTFFMNSKFDTHIGGGASGDGAWNRWNYSGTINNLNPVGDTRYAEYGDMNLSGTLLSSSVFAAWSHFLAAGNLKDSSGNDIFTLDHIFGPASYWNSLVDQTGKTWLDNGANNVWGPVNTAATAGTSGQTGFIDPSTVYSNPNFTLGGTWDPTVQIATVPEPATLAGWCATVAMLTRRRRPSN